GNVESHVDTSVKEVINPNVESSDKVSNKVEKIAAETLIPQNPKPGETLDEFRSNADDTIDVTLQSFVAVKDHVEPFDKATSDPVVESVKEKTTTPDVAQDPKTVQDGIGRRLRSRTTKPATTTNVTSAATKKVKNSSLKPVKYGPSRTWSKGFPPSDKKKKVLKRKSAPSSDYDYDVEKEAPSIKPHAKKVMTAKKSSQEVEEVPCDNVSFHLAAYAQRWNYVCKRRFALERELRKDILECEEIVNLIKEAGLMKTVWGMSECYEKLCVEFSPTIINKALENSDEPQPDIE
ncbi:envelope-like protein, partial [Trifolium medium]|nr:envelope-like protein [Trifolium medium]